MSPEQVEQALRYAGLANEESDAFLAWLEQAKTKARPGDPPLTLLQGWIEGYRARGTAPK